MENSNRNSQSQRKGRGYNNGKKLEKGLSQDTPLTALSVEDKLRLAGEVEFRLAEESNESVGRKLRIQLCQYLSDIVLSDPVVAVSEDCVGRLWRVCFYARINKLRGRISREAKKSKGESKAVLEESLKTFLGEATVLYDYLVHKLEDSVAGMSEEDGISAVACIYRLLIHLGDLHRYQRGDNKAEGCYLRASRLSPGRGNSYNQLAVVAQQASLEGGHPKSCLALYWYARSLMASVEPFQTSRSNLTRLFYFNRTWLEANPRPEGIPSGVNKRLIATHKSSLLRRFMAEFVDLQSFLLKLPDAPSPEEVIKQACSLFENFKSLLHDQSFGDSLLAKMAVILMFAVVYVNSPEDNNYPQLPFSCALRFGHSIASHLVSQPLSSSLRGLSPLLVFCLWLQNIPSNALPLKDHTDVVVLKDFWTSVADLGNHLQVTFASEELVDIPKDQRLPIENDLLGFSPMLSTTEKKPNSSPLSGFLPLNHSIQLLSPDLSKSSNISDHDSLCKVARFLLILRNLAASHPNKDAWPLLYDQTTATFSIHTSELSSQNLGIDLAASACAPQQPEPMDDFADDEIVYTGSANDNMGTPSAMETEKKDDNTMRTNPYTSGLLKCVTASSSDRQEVPKPIQVNIIKPPPGFSTLPSAQAHFLPPSTNNIAHTPLLIPPSLPNVGKILTPGFIGASNVDIQLNHMLPNPTASSIPPGFESLPKLTTTNQEAVNVDFNQLSQWPPFMSPNPAPKVPLETPWPATSNPFVGHATGAESFIGSTQSSSIFNNPSGFSILPPAPTDGHIPINDMAMQQAPTIDENEFKFLGSLMFDPTGFTNTGPSQSLKESPATRNPFMQ